MAIRLFSASFLASHPAVTSGILVSQRKPSPSHSLIWLNILTPLIDPRVVRMRFYTRPLFGNLFLPFGKITKSLRVVGRSLFSSGNARRKVLSGRICHKSAQSYLYPLPLCVLGLSFWSHRKGTTLPCDFFSDSPTPHVIFAFS